MQRSEIVNVLNGIIQHERFPTDHGLARWTDRSERETSGSPLTAAEDELRIKVVAHLQTEKASDIAADFVVDAAPVPMRAEPLVNLVQ